MKRSEMRIGTRVISPQQVHRWKAEIIQISVYYGKKGNLETVRKCAAECKGAGIQFVIHPVGYYLNSERSVNELMDMAEWTDIGMILHDERAPSGERLMGRYGERFRQFMGELSLKTHISFENAVKTADVEWFWDTFADSITLDIGHVEAAGIDSSKFINNLKQETINKIEFVHMHRNNGWRNGLTDHWHLLNDCREIGALRELLKKKTDIDVILEINEIEMLDQSIAMLRMIRSECAKSDI